MIIITAQEIVRNLDEFLKRAKERRHWFIDDFFGLRWKSVTLILTGLDEKDNIIKYEDYFGNTFKLPSYEEKKIEFERLKQKARKKIKDLPEDFTEGLWSMSK